MRRLLFIICLFFSFSFLLQGQSLEILWDEKIFIRSMAYGPMIKFGKSTSTYVIAPQGVSNIMLGFSLCKFDSLGELVWKRQYKDSIFAGFDVRPSALLLDSEDNAFIGVIVGYGASVGAPRDARVLKYSPSGNLLWEHNLGAGIADDLQIRAMDLDTVNRLVCVAGLRRGDSTNNPVAERYMFLSCLELETGVERWQKKLPWGNFPWNMEVQPNAIYLQLDYWDQDQKAFYTVQTIDPLTGDLKDSFSYSHDTYFHTYFNEIGNSGDLTIGSYSKQYSAEKIDLNGQKLWKYTYPDSITCGQTNQLFTDTENATYLGGNICPYQNPYYGHMLVTKLDQDGEVLWDYALNRNTPADTIQNTTMSLFADSSYCYVLEAMRHYTEPHFYSALHFLDAKTGSPAFNVEFMKDYAFTAFLDYQHITVADGRISVALYYQKERIVTTNDSLYVASFRIPQFVSVNDEPEPNGVTVYPNPAATYVQIQNIDFLSFKSLKVFDAAGKVVYLQPISLDQITLSTDYFEAGYYTIVLEGNDMKLTKKLIIQR
jgi:Secretion system C-terminal sorting domain